MAPSVTIVDRGTAHGDVWANRTRRPRSGPTGDQKRHSAWFSYTAELSDNGTTWRTAGHAKPTISPRQAPLSPTTASCIRLNFPVKAGAAAPVSRRSWPTDHRHPTAVTIRTGRRERAVDDAEPTS